MGNKPPWNNNSKDYGANKDVSLFDKILPDVPVSVSVQTRRIPYSTYSGTTKIITFQGKNKYHETIYKACAEGFQSDWFAEISERSKPEYFAAVRGFFDWVSEFGYQTTGTNRYEVLKAYEAYQMNDRGLRRTPLFMINSILREGLASPSFNLEDFQYLETLVHLSRPAKDGEREPVSLSNWFDLPWMRALIGENAYLQLESPSLLYRSFRVTIATTLLWLLAQRNRWQESAAIEFDQTSKVWQYDWDRLLFEHMGRFDERGEPEDDFSELLLLDLVVPQAMPALKSKLIQSGTKNLPKALRYKGKRQCIWQRPVFFHPEHQTHYTPVEELLCAWLIACEAIQPTDIPKLKTNNYAIEYNQSGRLVAMECTYYKGRAGSTKQPAILIGRDPWTRALYSYMEGLSEESLFRTRIAKQVAMSISGSRNHTCSLLYKIWKLPSFQQQLKAELRRTNASSLFLRAVLALEQGDDFHQFNNQTGQRGAEYRSLVSRPIPLSLFTLTHIKTTAVYSGSDVYREGDLINHHSHTSLTEKMSYLTDKNKEWVNQAGRITRLVLHDLQNVVFQPSITAIRLAVADLELRTQVIQATYAQDIETHSLQSRFTDYEDDEAIIVSDTTDTALYFIHYITQAEALFPKLLAIRPDWVERTLIIKIEWMVRMLGRMRMASTARKEYGSMEEHLPRLFDHLLETTE